MSHAGEFVWTWNMFLTLGVGITLIVATSLIIHSFKRQFVAQDDKNARIAELLKDIVDGKANALAEKEEIKAEHIEEGRKELKRIQDCIKIRLDEISKNIEKKVDWDHCNARRKEEDRTMKDLETRLRAGGI